MTGLRLLFILAGICVMLLAIGRPTIAEPIDNDSRAKEFIDDHVSHLRPLELAANRAWWAANISGRPE